MARVVLDASVVIAFLDASDAHHGAAVSALETRRADDKLLPASAFAEVLVRPCRVAPQRVAEMERDLAEISVVVVPITAEMGRRAAALRARHASLQFGDALVLAAGEILDATVLTADRAWARISRRARAI